MKHRFAVLALSLLAAFGGVSSVLAAETSAIVPVELNGTLQANDDGSTGAITLNIGGESGINFFGQRFTHVYVNNNGNLTFANRYGTYTPTGLSSGVGQPII